MGEEPGLRGQAARRGEGGRNVGKGFRGATGSTAVNRRGPSPTITIRIAETDLQRARALAARKGLRYQTYLKILLHEALDRDERKPGTA